MMRYLLFIFFLTFYYLSWSQDTILGYNDFLTIVKKHHPISYQANLAKQKGEAYLQKAKGGFDPKLYGNIDQKYYDGKQYYSYFNSGLKIPTWFGVTAQAGYVNTSGNYLNPEAQVPSDGLWYAGLSINLGNGLFIDKRRAELKQAHIYINSTEVEQKLILNQLVLDAKIAYLDWWKAYYKLKVLENAVDNAKKRFTNVKEYAIYGDKASIDTLKALIQVQNRTVKWQEAEVNLKNKKKYLETFLWQDGFIPLEIDNQLTPVSFQNLSPTQPNFNLIDNLDSLTVHHPEMIYYLNDIEMAKIDYRLKKEQIKPTVEIKYNALNAHTNSNFVNNYTIENYKWGATVNYPLFTRKERGSLKLAEINIQEKQSGIVLKQAQLTYKINNTYLIWLNTYTQVKLMMETVKNYKALFEAEKTLFNIGESSLFLVNVREQQLIDANLKLIELLFQNNVAKAQYHYQVVKF